MPETKILIIGGGSSGLSMAGALKHYGLSATILDKDAHTGDVWRERYNRLHLHTIKALSHSAYKNSIRIYLVMYPKMNLPITSQIMPENLTSIFTITAL